MFVFPEEVKLRVTFAHVASKGGAWWQFLPQALHFITLGEHGAVKFDFAPQNRTEVCNFIPRIMTKPLVQWLNRNFFNVSGNNKIPEFSLVWAFVSLKRWSPGGQAHTYHRGGLSSEETEGSQGGQRASLVGWANPSLSPQVKAIHIYPRCLFKSKASSDWMW